MSVVRSSLSPLLIASQLFLLLTIAPKFLAKRMIGIVFPLGVT
jgi:hypothetical protein